MQRRTGLLRGEGSALPPAGGWVWHARHCGDRVSRPPRQLATVGGRRKRRQERELAVEAGQPQHPHQRVPQRLVTDERRGRWPAPRPAAGGRRPPVAPARPRRSRPGTPPAGTAPPRPRTTSCPRGTRRHPRRPAGRRRWPRQWPAAAAEPGPVDEQRPAAPRDAPDHRPVAASPAWPPCAAAARVPTASTSIQDRWLTTTRPAAVAELARHPQPHPAALQHRPIARAQPAGAGSARQQRDAAERGQQHGGQAAEPGQHSGAGVPRPSSGGWQPAPHGDAGSHPDAGATGWRCTYASPRKNRAYRSSMWSRPSRMKKSAQSKSGSSAGGPQTQAPSRR